MQVFIARNLDNGNVLELDDLSFQFVLWLNENGFTELDDVYARSTLNTTVGEFNKLISAHSFEGEDEMIIPQLDYFVELNTWVSWTDDGPRDENEKISIVFEVAEIVYDRQTMTESYESIEIGILKSFLQSFKE